MNRGARRQPVFLTDAACATFLEIVGGLPERFGVRVHGYSLMPNHYHLLVESIRGNLSRAMQHLGAAYTAALNIEHEGWDGPVFRGRFRNRVVFEEHYWMHLLAYVHLNPVRARLVPSVHQSRWTSHAAYAGTEEHPAWLTTSEMLDLFGGAEAYSEYVRELVAGRTTHPAGFDPETLWSPTPSRPLIEELPAKGVLAEREAISQVCGVTGARPWELKEGRRGVRGNPARWLAAGGFTEAPECPLPRSLRRCPRHHP